MLPIFFVPALLKGVAITAGVVGAGSAINGVINAKDAQDTVEAAKNRHEQNVEKLEKEEKKTSEKMDELGKFELKILDSFKKFIYLIEQIKNRPIFEEYSKNGVTLSKYDGERIKDVSVGAGVLLGGISGTASGFAASGCGIAASAAVASTVPLSIATLGVGLLVGGVVFNFTGEKLSNQAYEAWNQMLNAEKKINDICTYLVELQEISENYYDTLSKVNNMYQHYLKQLNFIVDIQGNKDWNLFTKEEKLITKNTVDLVNLLNHMCKVELVLQSESENDINRINSEKVQKSIKDANTVLNDIK